MIEKGRKTQIKNGKSKGKKNPMYGKLSYSKKGFREDLDHFVRSTWEADFCRILKYLDLDYEYEKHTFELDGTTYTPDFYIPSKDKFYEIKGFSTYNKHIIFNNFYPDKKLVLVDYKFLRRLIDRFSNKVCFDDKIRKLSKKQVEEMFSEYCKNNNSISIRSFCKEYNISIKFISKVFENQVNLLDTYKGNKENINYKRYYKKTEDLPSYKKLLKQFEEYILQELKLPCRKNFLLRYDYYGKRKRIESKYGKIILTRGDYYEIIYKNRKKIKIKICEMFDEYLNSGSENKTTFKFHRKYKISVSYFYKLFENDSNFLKYWRNYKC